MSKCIIQNVVMPKFTLGCFVFLKLFRQNYLDSYYNIKLFLLCAKGLGLIHIHLYFI